MKHNHECALNMETGSNKTRIYCSFSDITLAGTEKMVQTKAYTISRLTDYENPPKSAKFQNAISQKILVRFS